VDIPPVGPGPIPGPEVLGLIDPTAEELTSLYEISFSAANMQRFNLGDRMFQIQQSVVPPPPVPPPPSYTKEGKEVEGKAPPPAPQPSPTNRWGVWANGWGDFVNLDSTSIAQGYRFTTGGMSAGVDYLIIPNHFAVGLFGGYSHTWVNFTPSGSATANTGRGGLYATYFNQGWWVNTAIWGGGSNYSTSRQALAGTANGETSGWEFSTFGDAGYDFHWNDLAFGPTVSMQYTRVYLNGFGENGSLIPLEIHGGGQNSLRTDVEGQAYYKLLVGKIPVIPTVRLAWEHEYKYSNLPISASAPALGTSATFYGPDEGHDSMIINANIAVQWTPRIWTTIGYDGQVARDNYNSNAVTGTFSFSF
jgi:outer membrane lipase/esterase